MTTLETYRGYELSYRLDGDGRLTGFALHEGSGGLTISARRSVEELRADLRRAVDRELGRVKVGLR